MRFDDRPKILLLALAFAAAAVAAQMVTETAAGEAPKPAAAGITEVKALDLDLFCRHWIRSHEEEKAGDNGELFRPAGSKGFPASHFRMQYKFSKNGDCEWLWLAPDDAHRMKPGKWSQDPQDPMVVRIDSGGKKISFRIAELSKESLRLVMLERIPGQ